MTSSGQAGTNTGYIIFLSVASAIGGILFGYDTAVLAGHHIHDFFPLLPSRPCKERFRCHTKPLP